MRVAAAATFPIWFDEATMGLMGRDVLHGQLPLFFYGQSFMGAIDGYLHAVTFAFLWESVVTLRVMAILVSLGHAAVVALLAGRVFGEGWWAAALALVPSAYALKWVGDARLVYGLILILVPLCLLLTLSAVNTRSTRPCRSRALVILALVAGMCCWVNLLLAPVLVACALALLLRRPQLDRSAVLAPLAFLLGSAPVWLFAPVYGRLPVAAVPLVPLGRIADHSRDLLTNALPLMTGAPHGTLAAWPVGVAAVAIVTLGLVLALSDPGGDRTGRLLLALAIASSVAAVLVTDRGQALATEDPRYLLPVLALLPALLGGALARVARRHPAWAGAAGVGLVVAHGVGVATVYPALRSADAWRASRIALDRPAAGATALATRGFRTVYTHDPDVVSFVSGGGVTVAHFYLADDPIRAGHVDGARTVAYLAPEQIPAGFADSLAAAGIRFEREETPFGQLFTGFRLEPVRWREIPPVQWTAAASSRPELAGHAIDRDAGTQWATARRPDAWLQVDLGHVHLVGMVTWLPGTYQEMPLGFRLDTSIDGVRWTVAREVPVYYGPLYWAAGHPMGRVRWGRVETRFPPQSARYLRLTHVGQGERFPWTVRELFVYEAADQTPEPPLDARAAAGALLAMGARRVYADHGEGPRLVDAASERLRGVAGQRAGGPLRPGATTRAASVPRGGAGHGRRVSGGDAVGTVDRGRTSNGRSGLRGCRCRRLPAPRSARVDCPTRSHRDVVQARVIGEPAGGNAYASRDGRLETRWSSRAPQAPGQWLQVDLDAPAELSGFELDLGGAVFEYPRRLEVQIAREAGWEGLGVAVRWAGPLVWTGTHVLRAGVERVVVSFPSTRVRALRIVQTGRDAFHPWSVAELRLLAP